MADFQTPHTSGAELEIKRRGRRRLIGAFTLGLLAVVFLPMVFDSEPKPEHSVSKEVVMVVPAKEGQPSLPPPALLPATESAKMDISKPAAKLSAESQAPSNPEPAVAPSQSESKPVDKKPVDNAPPAVVTSVQPNKSTPPSKSTPQPSETGKFAIQLGAFNDADNIKQIVGKMKEAKLPVYTEKIAVAKGAVTRIRVGPYPSREKADQILEQIRKTGTQGKIVPL